MQDDLISKAASWLAKGISCGSLPAEAADEVLRIAEFARDALQHAILKGGFDEDEEAPLCDALCQLDDFSCAFRERIPSLLRDHN